MEAVAHSEKFAKKVGVPMSVGKDFAAADKGRKFGTGGSTGVTYGGQGQINKQRTRFGSKFGYKLNVPNESLNKYVGKAEGGNVKTFRKGGTTSSAVASINKQQTNHGQMQMPNVSLNKYVKRKEGGIMKSVDSSKNPGLAKLPTDVRNKMGYMKKGGKAGEDMKMDKAQDKAMIKKAIGMHDKQEHPGEKTNLSKLKKGGMSCAPKKMAMGGMARMASKGEHPVQKQAKRGAEMVKMAKGGLAAGHKSADGIATKGKTRAMAPAMRKGGKVC